MSNAVVVAILLALWLGLWFALRLGLLAALTLARCWEWLKEQLDRIGRHLVH